MVTLYRAAAWKISVYGRDHGVPHFHIEGRAFRCSVTISTLELLVGSAPPGVLKTAIAWARASQAELMAKWKELNE
jgi:hypothetical protein